jgi:hypothetical protein
MKSRPCHLWSLLKAPLLVNAWNYMMMIYDDDMMGMTFEVYSAKCIQVHATIVYDHNCFWFL